MTRQVVEQCGRGALARTLNGVLVAHIRASLPQLRARLEAALDKCGAELRVYGDAPPGQTSAARSALPPLSWLLRPDVGSTGAAPGCGCAATHPRGRPAPPGQPGARPPAHVTTAPPKAARAWQLVGSCPAATLC